MFAVIRVRGEVDTKRPIRDTFTMLRLHEVNHCIVIPNTPNYKGMIRKVKDFITWGEIDEKTLEELVRKRGRKVGDKPLDEKETKELIADLKKGNKPEWFKPVFRLNPPRNGYRSIKQAFPRGALGNRKEKINELIMRML